MARPQKPGLEYFPLDVDIASDEKVEYIEAKHGLIGFAILIHLFAAIYRNGYYMSWGERQQYVFSKRVNVDINTISMIVNDCINSDLFDKNLFDKYGILTSNGIQSRYLQACERRKNISIIKEYLIALPQDKVKSKISYILAPKNVNVDINTNSNDINADNNPTEQELMSAKTPQSKVKESKVYISSSTTTENQIDLSDPDLGEVITSYSNNIHPITPIEAEQLADLMNDCSKEFMLEAIKRAVVRGKRSLGYIKSILDDWQVNGMDDGKPKTTRFKSQPKKSTLSPALQGLKEIMEGEDSA